MRITKTSASGFASESPVEVKSPAKSPAAAAAEAQAAANKAAANLDVFRLARSFSNPLMPSSVDPSVMSILLGPAAVQNPGDIATSNSVDAGLSPNLQDPLQNSISGRHGAVNDLFVGIDGLAGIVAPQSTIERRQGSINPNASDDGESDGAPASPGAGSGSAPEEGDGKGVWDFVTHVVTEVVAEVVGEFVGPVTTIVEGAETGAEGIVNEVKYFKNLDEKSKDATDPPVEPSEPSNVDPPEPTDDGSEPSNVDPPEPTDPDEPDEPDSSTDYVGDAGGYSSITPVVNGKQSGGSRVSGGFDAMWFVDQAIMARAAAPYDPSRDPDVQTGPTATRNDPGTQEYRVPVDFTPATVTRVTGPYDPHESPGAQEGPAGERPDPRTNQ